MFALLGGVVLLAAAACAEEELIVPTAEQVESYYSYSGRLEAEMSGNVAEIDVYQPDRLIRRGGGLWARVGPYIFLFSNETRQLLTDFNGLAGVRVVTRSQGGREVARAFLHRDSLNELTWRRALNISGRARRDGTSDPELIADLVRWGEDHTEYEYDSRFVN